MRATGRSAVLAAGLVLATPLAAGAQALPPPPYQSADRSGMAYPQLGPQSIDRYGGGYPRSSIAARQPYMQGAAQQPSGPYLAWAGKTELAAAPAPSAQTGGWTDMANRWGAEPQRPVQPQYQPQFQPQAQSQYQPQAQPQMQAAQMAPPSNEWRPYRPQNAAPTPAAPASIYDAPQQPYRQAQATPAQSTAANGQSGPRFYSLHREYGIQPDPIPLPPQFFGPTADLSASVAEPLAKRTTTVNGQTKTVNVPDDQGAQ